MKLLLVRHGDPDYSHDALTEKGKLEAQYLAERLVNEKIDSFYVSPLGRAKETASYTLDAVCAEAKVKDWLQEFPCRIVRPDTNGLERVVWDWLPADWTVREEFFEKDRWYDNPLLSEKKVREEYDRVCTGLDDLLKEYGYERQGNFYHTEQGTHAAICLFCHFGVEMVLLSHLLNISPMCLWHGFAAAPSSVTTLFSEERREGCVSFRVTEYGSIEHLYVHGMKPSFQARFAECFRDEDRH